MLQKLNVKNFALIDKVEVDFNSGFSVITGETGSGKSILIDALGLVLGERADVKLLRDEQTKCIVEAEFRISDYRLKSFFSKQDLDYEEDSIIRREILPSGKSRAFINDTPVTLNILKELSNRLVDIHSQHQNLALNDKSFLYKILDSFAKINLNHYSTVFEEYKVLKQNLTELRENESKQKLDIDYYQFQLNELVEANLIEGELKSKEEELKLVSNAEHIKNALEKSVYLLNESDQNILTSLEEIKNELNQISDVSEEFSILNDRVQSTLIELKDLTEELETNNSNSDFETSNILELTERINLINNLLSKHRLQTEDELIELKESLSAKLQDANSFDERIAQLELELNIKNTECKAIALKIEEQRLSNIPNLEKKINSILSDLSMSNAQIKVDLNKADGLNYFGLNTIEFLFKANKGGAFNPVNKVASGGELSRLMLAIKFILAKSSVLPTLIFDEIDTGVSGEVANKMGKLIKDMSKKMQVFSISHLPQIAGKAETHYKVFKFDQGDKTTSSIKLLNNNERIEEIAMMLNGQQLSEAAISNAKELLNN